MWLQEQFSVFMIKWEQEKPSPKQTLVFPGSDRRALLRTSPSERLREVPCLYACV